LQHGNLNAIEAVKKWVEDNEKDIKVYNPFIGEELEF